MEKKEMDQETSAPMNAELSDEAVGDVAGGGYQGGAWADGYRVVDPYTSCSNGKYLKGYCESPDGEITILRQDNQDRRKKYVESCTRSEACGTCYHMVIGAMYIKHCELS